MAVTNSTPETIEGRTLYFTAMDDSVSAWLTTPERPVEHLVGVWSTADQPAWVTHYTYNRSVEFPGMSLAAWENLVRRVHLYRR